MTDQYGLPIEGQTCSKLHEDVLVGRIAQRLKRPSNAVPGVCQICGAVLPVVVRVAKDGHLTDYAPNTPEIQKLRAYIKEKGGIENLSDEMLVLPVSICEKSGREDLWKRAQQKNADAIRTARVNAAAAAGIEYKPTPRGLGWS